MRYLDKLKKINEDFGADSQPELPHDPRISAADDEANLESPNLELPAKNTHDKLLLQANESPSGHTDDGSISFKIVGEGQQASLELDGQEVDMLGRWLEKFKPHVTQPTVTGQEIPDQQQRQINELGCSGGQYETEYSRLQQEDKEDDAFYAQFEEPKKAPPPPKPPTVNSGGGRIKMEEEELAALVSGIVEEMLSEMGNPNEAPPPAPKKPREMDDRDRKYNPMGENQFGDQVHRGVQAKRQGLWFLAHEPNKERVITAYDVQNMKNKYGLDVEEGDTFTRALKKLQGMVQKVEDLPRESGIDEIQHGGSTPKGKADYDLSYYGSGDGKMMRSRTMHQDLKAQAGKNLRGTERKEIERGKEEIDENGIGHPQNPYVRPYADKEADDENNRRSGIVSPYTRRDDKEKFDNHPDNISEEEIDELAGPRMANMGDPNRTADPGFQVGDTVRWSRAPDQTLIISKKRPPEFSTNMGGRSMVSYTVTNPQSGWNGGVYGAELSLIKAAPRQAQPALANSNKGSIGGGHGFAESWAAYNKKHGKG